LTNVLEVKDLRVGRKSKERFNTILENVSFTIEQGEFVAIVGESGCGKSMTALSIMGLLPNVMQVGSGSIYYNGKELTKMTVKEINKIRGNEISMIFQEPMTSLNPSFTIGNQLAEVYKYHTNLSDKEIRIKCIEVLKQVRIPDAEEKLKVYPHELSGGMRQRVMIAMALACNPKILIADEPTTALDVTIQAQILTLLKDLQRELNMTVVMITHDLGVVAETCQKAIVMYAGQVIEEAEVEDLFEDPKHPYTQALMMSVPKLGNPDQVLYTIEGMVPDSDHMPKGCRFHPRCTYATHKCIDQEPELDNLGNKRRVRCWNKL